MTAPTESAAEQETARIQALIDYAVLDTAPEPAFDDITRLAAHCLQAPISLVTFVDKDRQWFKSRLGVDATETPRAGGFCNAAIQADQVFEVEDALADERFAAHPLVVGEPWIRFYAGASLLSPEGHAIGSLCVIDQRSRRLSLAEREMLEALARQVVSQLELRKRNRELGQTLGSLGSHLQELSEVQRRLESTETRLQLVVRGSNDGWMDWNLVTGERYFSPRGWEILGYEDQALPYDDALWRHLVFADDGDRVMAGFVETMRGSGSLHTAEFRMRHRLGHAVPVLSRGYLLRNEEGRVLRFSGTITNLTPIKSAESERLRVLDSFKALFTHSIDGVLQTAPDGGVIVANPAACAMLGRTEAEICALGRNGLLDLDDPRIPAMLAERERNGHVRGEVRMIRANGERFEVEISSTVYFDQEGRRAASAVFRDNTERRLWAERLERSSALLDNLAQHVPGVIYQYLLRPDGQHGFPFASRGMWDIYELAPEVVRENADPVMQRLHPEDIQAVVEAIEESARSLQPWHQEYRVVLPRQGLRWRQGHAQPERLGDGSVLWHGFISDITERKRAEAQTHRLAFYDALTGLPNRRLLAERIELALASAGRSGHFGALLFIDLDNFKQINDARGHAVGDRLLQAVALRLGENRRSEDTVARLGGDEFVVLIGRLGTEVEPAALHAQAVAEKVREVLDATFDIDNTAYSSSGSIGITLFPKASETAEDLLREADIAMYRAKTSGRNRIAFFAASMQAEVEYSLVLEQDLKLAVAAGEFRVHVQSQFDADGREAGGELLLRWTHPTRGTVSPAVFIPVAEESGLIFALGDFVIQQACTALARLQAAGVQSPLSINVSPRQFHKDDFVDRVKAILEATGARATGLIFEVTEGLLIDNWDATLERISALVALGIRFSIDDFGTGYSSLSYLKKLPLYELKIDKSFVQDTPEDPNDTAIVQAILSVASHLGLRVVAEGVETQAQADFLRASHCSCLQGFLFARPEPIEAWLARRLQASLNR